MIGKFVPALCLAVLTGCCLFSVTAVAVEIDPELQDLLRAKNNSDRVPVLMVFDDPAHVEELRAELDQMSPRQRRKLVVENLRLKAAGTQAAARDFLCSPANADQVGRVQTLYLASALAFEASAAVVTAMGLLPDRATLFFDKTYDLASGTRPGPPPEAKMLPAATDTAWGVKYIGADQVWSQLGFTGAGVVVGHIDSGIYLTHPDLESRLWINPGEIPGNGIDDDGNGFIDDIHGWDFGANDNNPNDDSPDSGHGTHTAGTVAGDGTGGTLTGVAPGALLMAAKVWQADGSGGTQSMIWAAEQYCVENGARIITMSLGITGDIHPYFMRNERLNCNNIRDAGVTFFNSAGNDHFVFPPPFELGLTARVPPPWLPGGHPHSSSSGVITVGGTGYMSDTIYNYSSRGPANWGNVAPWFDWSYSPGAGLIKPDISVPGSGVNSTVIPSGYSGDTWSGTSMACPHAAGVAALMLEKNPSLSPAGIDSLMETWAVDLGAPGKDNDFGSGRINALITVTATPPTENPDISWSEVMPDPFGDEVLDSGQMSDMAFQLMNASPVADATNLTGHLTVKANPYVTVVDGACVFSDIPAGGGLGDNLASPFILEVESGAPQGYEFTMYLTVTGSFFQKTFDIRWAVGLPDFRTHDIGDVYLTITDQGIIGYMDHGGGEGEGMGPHGGLSELFVGSFWAGTSEAYICNRDYNGLGSENFEWIVSGTDPNGRVRDLGAFRSDETFRAVFTDGGHADPLPLQVEQTSLTFATAPDNTFVILEYQLTNFSANDIPTLYTGIYCDFDIGESITANMAGTDEARNLVYQYAPGGNYYGIVLLGGEIPVNLTVVNNPIYVYANSAVTDADKFGLISGALSHPDGQQSDDWSGLASAAVSLKADGGQAKVAYALVYGSNLDELLFNAEAAIQAYDPVAPITGQAPLKIFRLGQNHPNPFNPVTTIRYSLEREASVELAVFDVSGKKIRTLASGIKAPGDHVATWNGADNAGSPVPSGLYFYQLLSGSDVETRKMMLVK